MLASAAEPHTSFHVGRPHLRHVLLETVASFALAATAAAQSFNIDLHGPTPALVPSPAYGAAAQQPGAWNGFPCTTACDNLVVPLFDLAGGATPVTALVFHLGTVRLCPDPSISGDDEALLENGALLDDFDPAYLAIEHLQPGTYDVYGYAGDACAAPIGPLVMYTYVDEPGHTTHQAREFAGSGWSGGFQEGANFARIRCRVEAGDTLRLHLQAEGRMAQGFQLVLLRGDVHPVCFGTNVFQAFCPCGQEAFGRGCPSSVAPDGAALDGTGHARVAADTLQLTATHMPDAPVLVFQGTQFAGIHTEAAPFGDGFLCASGSIVRIATKTASMGSATYPEANDPPISQRGGVPATGGFRLFQVWYRNAAPFCTSATFNLTNAVAVDWR